MAAARATAPLECSSALDLAQVGLEAVHTPHQTPPVDLELCFTRAPRTDASGLLAERVPTPAQPG